MGAAFLFQKLAPLYFIMAFGYLLKFTKKLDTKSLGYILIYYLAPVIILHSAWKLQISIGVLLAPLVVYFIGVTGSILFLNLGNFFLKDNRKNILALASGTGNTTFFGFPLAFAFFDASTLPVYIFAIMGNILFENTFGFYFCSNGKYSKWQSFKNVLTLPNVYALLLGLGLNHYQVAIPEFYDKAISPFQVFYIAFGMIIIGLNISKENFKYFDLSFTSLAFVSRFIYWPLAVYSFIFFDSLFFFLFPAEVYKSLMLIAIVPFAANTVVIATLFGVHPQKMAAAVFLSYIFALVYIPILGNRLFL